MSGRPVRAAAAAQKQKKKAQTKKRGGGRQDAPVKIRKIGEADWRYFRSHAMAVSETEELRVLKYPLQRMHGVLDPMKRDRTVAGFEIASVTPDEFKEAFIADERSSNDGDATSLSPGKTDDDDGEANGEDEDDEAVMGAASSTFFTDEDCSYFEGNSGDGSRERSWEWTSISAVDSGTSLASTTKSVESAEFIAGASFAAFSVSQCVTFGLVNRGVGHWCLRRDDIVSSFRSHPCGRMMHNEAGGGVGPVGTGARRSGVYRRGGGVRRRVHHARGQHQRLASELDD